MAIPHLHSTLLVSSSLSSSLPREGGHYLTFLQSPLNLWPSAHADNASQDCPLQASLVVPLTLSQLDPNPEKPAHNLGGKNPCAGPGGAPSKPLLRGPVQPSLRTGFPIPSCSQPPDRLVAISPRLQFPVWLPGVSLPTSLPPRPLPQVPGVLRPKQGGAALPELCLTQPTGPGVISCNSRE